RRPGQGGRRLPPIRVELLRQAQHRRPAIRSCASQHHGPPGRQTIGLVGLRDPFAGTLLNRQVLPASVHLLAQVPQQSLVVERVVAILLYGHKTLLWLWIETVSASPGNCSPLRWPFDFDQSAND